MTQEEKNIYLKGLLVKDLCARLPYVVKICVDGYICTLLDINTETGNKLNGETFHVAGFNKPNGEYNFCTISEVKPYLRPMSSMTEEEKIEYSVFFNYDGVEYPDDYIDWLNEKMFDHRGLIEKGLALEAPEGMYKI